MEFNEDTLEVHYSNHLLGKMKWCDLLEEWGFDTKYPLRLGFMIELCLIIHRLTESRPTGA